MLSPTAERPTGPTAKKTAKTGPATPNPWARIAIGVFGGYITMTLLITASAALLPIHRSDAVVLGLLVGGLIYTLLFIHVFAVDSWKIALRDLGGLSAVSALIILIARGISGS